MTIKLDHINLTVANFTESLNWYKKIFGFELVEEGKKPQGARWGVLAFSDSMICMTEYKERVAANKAEEGIAHKIYHFGLRVSDAQRWQQIVQDHQLKVSYGGPVSYPFSTSWYITDPSGHEIEVSYSASEQLQFPGGRDKRQ